MEQAKSRETAQQNQNTTNGKQIAVSSMLFIFIASLAAYLHYSRRDQPFKPYIDTSSYYAQQGNKIYAGEIHYSRVPVQYWEHRIQMIKSMGLNALSVYIMWNHHEIQRGKFDFETQNKNLDLFLSLAQKHQMKVLMRPGPYVCAEWDWGGLPARLLAVPGLKIRSKQAQFMQQVRIYFTALAPILREHIWTPESPQKSIILLQIQNEYGFFGTDVDYIMQLRQIWRSLKVITSEYYVDWIINVRKSHWQGANIGLNDAFTQIQIDYIKTTLQPSGMVFGGEIYSGWLTFWHAPVYESVDPYHKVKQYQFLMSHNISYAMYVAHGGTSFGLSAGSNSRYVQKMGFSGQLTTYDYDAPINEQGSQTQKYRVFRESIKKYANWQVPQIPDAIPMKKIPSFKMQTVATLYENINWAQPQAIADHPLPFQSQQLKMFHLGIVIYQIQLPPNSNYSFVIESHDITYITIDSKLVQTLDRTLDKTPTIVLACKLSTNCIVRFLVQAMGHINYDLSMKDDFKGIVSFQRVSGEATNFSWKMYTVPLHDNKLLQWNTTADSTTSKVNTPVLLKATVKIDQPADTYLNMTSFGKGYVWVNNRNLGRYWNVGPQFKLFCPGVWLKKGDNQIAVLDLEYSGDHSIRGDLTLKDQQKE